MPNISKKNKRPIGVFDSGVGGLSVLTELQRLLPNENFVFLADQLYVPYGEKSKKEIIGLTSKITNYFIKKHKIKMMVVACNTATCNALAELREKFTLPIVGTVPAVKAAAEKTKSKTIAVISTPLTSQSATLKKLIKDYCKNLKVFNIGCKNLEDTVERGELHSERMNKLLFKYLTRVKKSNADYLVLGCTHYVFLKRDLWKFVGSRIKLIDGNLGIAKHTKSLLVNHFLENSPSSRAKLTTGQVKKEPGRTLYFTTGDPVQFSKVATKLLKIYIKAKQVKI